VGPNRLGVHYARIKAYRYLLGFPTMTMNVTSAFYDSLVPSPLTYPWYHSPKPDLLDWISDKHLSLAAPVIAYWVYSMFFHALDTFEFQFFDKYRIHESEEVKSRNLVSRTDVIKAVVLQHVIQTILGLVHMDEAGSESSYDHTAGMRYWAPWVVHVVRLACGPMTAENILESYGQQLVHFTYWWFIPGVQFIFALLVVFFFFFFHATIRPELIRVVGS
jgi:sphinganine C4-monooxygenase